MELMAKVSFKIFNEVAARKWKKVVNRLRVVGCQNLFFINKLDRSKENSR